MAGDGFGALRDTGGNGLNNLPRFNDFKNTLIQALALPAGIHRRLSKCIRMTSIEQCEERDFSALTTQLLGHLKRNHAADRVTAQKVWAAALDPLHLSDIVSRYLLDPGVANAPASKILT